MKSQANTAIVSKCTLTTYKMKHTVTSQQSTHNFTYYDVTTYRECPDTPRRRASRAGTFRSSS